MPYVSVYVDSDDVLQEMDDDELRAELDARMKRKPRGVDEGCSKSELSNEQLIERIYLFYRGKADVPRELAELVFRTIGRIM